MTPEDLQAEIQRVLASISPAEWDLLKRNLGLELSDPPTLEQLEALFEFKVTRERIVEIEREALRKLGERGEPSA